MTEKLAVFKGKGIRRTIHNNEWWFVIADVVSVLTDSVNPADYIKKMRSRDKELAKGWGQIVTPLSVDTQGGKQRVNCANTEGIFRIIQSIPSPKAEPFKRWLARVGYERVQEIEDPELGTARTRELYRAKGYSEAWIEKRMRGIAVRAELTEEWKNRDVGGSREYAILTAEISKATFGMTPSEYKDLKQLDRENLRDHMTDLELIFSMLGEAATTEIARTRDAQGFTENRSAAGKGGKIAGDARKKLEQESGRKVVTDENYLDAPERQKRLERKK
ncbi:BRO-N domain-containing protein [Geothermobacter hydrogeniphilus]|uniref:Phage antirepressor protein n=1 Tax=Geothermobacter hydrogeniphilus TaxID=1969733 RepID=A0A1X0Y272_9BACT|nr:Bro-N domain-containing protein [Geothermobacter hydrogeniphilus]ORJ59311.1 phage antirepressor protein [Geothermobacter hydrogeniphilus]